MPLTDNHRGLSLHHRHCRGRPPCRPDCTMGHRQRTTTGGCPYIVVIVGDGPRAVPIGQWAIANGQPQGIVLTSSSLSGTAPVPSRLHNGLSPTDNHRGLSLHRRHCRGRPPCRPNCTMGYRQRTTIGIVPTIRRKVDSWNKKKLCSWV